MTLASAGHRHDHAPMSPRLASLLAASTLFVSVAARAEPTPCRALAPKETLQVDLREAPLGDLARLVSCALGRSLLFSPPELANQQVTFLGPRPLSRRELDALWHATLANAGLIEERHGAFEVVRKARP